MVQDVNGKQTGSEEVSNRKTMLFSRNFKGKKYFWFLLDKGHFMIEISRGWESARVIE